MSNCQFLWIIFERIDMVTLLIRNLNWSVEMFISLEYFIYGYEWWQWGGAGRGWRMGSSSLARMVLSYPIPVLSCMTGKNFSPHPRPLGPREASPHLVKLYFLLIFPTTSIIFLMKPISLIKIYLKLQLNLSHQIKSIFRKKKNWIIYPIV